MKIFDGKKAAQKILKELGEEIAKTKRKPKLAVILVGEDEASKLYIRLKKEVAQKIGIEIEEFDFSADESEGKIFAKIVELNKDRKVSGIIVQLPLPKKFNENKIIGAVNPKKDVDGFQKNSWFSPVLPSAILFTIKKATKLFKKKKVVALVNSKIFGQTLKSFFKKEGIKLDYILRKKHSFFENKNKLKRANIIITVLGSPNFIRGDMIKKKAILIDAGISKIAAKKVVGDVNKESVKGKAAFLTPVPGGIGPLTVALLLKNTYLSAKNYGKHSHIN